MDFKIRIITGVWEKSNRNANLPLEFQEVLYPTDDCSDKAFWGDKVINYLQRAVMSFEFKNAKLSIHGKAIPAETILRNEFLPSCHHRWETFVSLFAGIESEFLSGQHHFVLYIPDDKEHEVFHIYVRTY
jgi:hypothetical protein